jgi:site-specific recombinase XerC
MKAVSPTELGQGILRFFEDYLPAQRGMSPHTIHSYRDALILLLRRAAHARTLVLLRRTAGREVGALDRWRRVFQYACLAAEVAPSLRKPPI